MIPQEAEGAPAEVAPPQDRARLLVIEADAALRGQLLDEARARGLEAEGVADVAAGRTSLLRRRPDVVLLGDLSPAGQALLPSLGALSPPVPALLLSPRGDLLGRVAAAHLGGGAFLHRSMPPGEVLEAVAQALVDSGALPGSLLIVDDDPQMLALLRALLLPCGLRLLTLDDPRRFWEVLEEAAPDLLVLDLDMPHVSGLELCRVVRADPRWSALPVLFLTAHGDDADVRHMYAAGADDFVHKPVVGPELVGRILNRLSRTQLQTRLAEADPLTGLRNRRGAGPGLEQLLRLARREGRPLSVAMLDLDHFKQVNDRFGHAAGDAVLRRLAALLLGWFRGEDVVGRWGGEEFMIGMFGMRREDGVRRLQLLLERLQAEAFTGPAGAAFRVSFSAGVAEFPTDGDDAALLCAAADRALYRAKASGRARVLAGQRRGRGQGAGGAAGAVIAGLRARYAPRLRDRLDTLASTLAAARTIPALLGDAEAQAHRIRGTAGSYQFGEISELSGLIEDALLALREGGHAAWRPEWQTIEEALRDLGEQARGLAPETEDDTEDGAEDDTEDGAEDDTEDGAEDGAGAQARGPAQRGQPR